MSKKILVIFGIQPEAIKMVSLIKGLKSRGSNFEVHIYLTAHCEIFDQAVLFASKQ